jgi:DNA-binding response OmpR family regulator
MELLGHEAEPPAPQDGVPPDTVIRVGELEIRPSDHVAIAGGRTLLLSERELELLAELARQQDRIVPREELYTAVWRAPLREADRSVDVYVHKLRSKLAAALPEWRFIHTHFGFGYRFAPEPSRPFHKSATSR